MKFDLNSLIESFNKLNETARYGILGGLAVLILGLDVFFLALSQVGAISQDSDQVKKLSDDTQQVLVDRVRINPLRRSLKETRLQLNSLSAKVRLLQEVPAILSTISSTANEYGVKIDQLVPEKNLQEVLTTASDGKYYALPVVIKARCGYHKFGHFLNKLENENLSFILQDFIIQNGEKDLHTHSFSLTIKIILVDHAGVVTKNL